MSLGKGGDIGGDIITSEKYEDFDLYLEWAIAKGGNSGILFHVLEGDYPAVYATGPEYQVLDDVGYPGELEEWQKAGANYAMHIDAERKHLNLLENLIAAGLWLKMVLLNSLVKW